MQNPRQPPSGLLTTTCDLLIRGTMFLATLCGRESEKKSQAYDWEERLAYVGEEVDEDDGSSGDEHDMQLERSCGVARYKD